MTTLFSRIFGRTKAKPVIAPDNNDLAISALKPLMAPQEFAPLQSKTATPEPQNLDPEHLSGAWRMEQVLQVFPSAQRALSSPITSAGAAVAATIRKIRWKQWRSIMASK